MQTIGGVVTQAAGIARRVSDELYYARVCASAGLMVIDPPRTGLAIARAVRRYGQLGSATAIAGARNGDRTAIVDERGSLTFGELDDRVNRLANGLIARGVRGGDGVALLMRNHAGLIESIFACGKAGARIILLNTDFAGPQIRDVADREGARLLICDEEYAPLLDGWDPPLGRVLAWTDAPDFRPQGGAETRSTIEALIAAHPAAPPPAPSKRSSVVILTSGTTGSPKGAPREEPKSLAGPGALFSKVPVRPKETTVIGVPLFHSLGFAHGIGAVMLGSTMVLRRRFDPERALDDIATHRATAFVAVPIMLQRLLDAVDADGGKRDLSTLKIVFVAGSQLGGALCTRALATLGPVVYNLYGSTEVAYATIATPEDLAIAPDCVGRAPRGTRVRIVDERGRELPTGETGRIFVGNVMAFDGYTSGETKERLPDGLMSSGDVGHLDEAGRLFIDGRDDDMIVSGGENVFPQEVEELLHAHEAIREAAVIGVDDPKFGARLAAFVVTDGSELGADDVREFVRGQLARYKVPRDVVFLDELPRNPTGKVLKRELPTATSSPDRVADRPSELDTVLSEHTD